MASGLLHTTTTLCAAAVGTSYYGLDNIPASSAWLLAGLYCTVIQPDLDTLETGYYGLYVLDKTKKGLSNLWQIYWYGYSRILKHRSFFSHAPIVGTFIRMVYGGWFLIPMLPLWEGTPYLLTAVIALDTLHWILDWRVWGALRLFRQ